MGRSREQSGRVFPRDLPTGDKANNLTKAIAAYEDALTVRTKEALPAQWANTLGNLAAAWRDLPYGQQSRELLHKAIAAYEDVLTIYGDGAVPAVQLSAEASLSWTQLLARDFQGALATARPPAAGRGGRFCFLERNHAHALLFLGRIAEAKAINLKHLGEQSEQSGKTWEQVVLEDFDELEKNGLTSPEIPNSANCLPRNRASIPLKKGTGSERPVEVAKDFASFVVGRAKVNPAWSTPLPERRPWNVQLSAEQPLRCVNDCSERRPPRDFHPGQRAAAIGEVRPVRGGPGGP